MRSEHMVAFFLFAVVAAITPGPSNVMLTAAGANAGILKGMPTLFGVAVGMGLMMFLVPLGLGSVVLSHPLVLIVLKGCGIAFLLWLAWKIATADHTTTSMQQTRISFARAALFQWVNPKSWLVSVSVAGTYLQADNNVLMQATLLSGLFVLAALPSCFVWLAFGASVQRMLRSGRSMKIFNITMALLLVLSIVLIL